MLHESLTKQIIGVYYDVYNELGGGFLESVYETAMEIALQEAGLSVERQVPIEVWFRGMQIGAYRADMIVEGKVLLELKSCKALESAHESQVLHYLRATECEVGLLMNFGPTAKYKRLVFENSRKKGSGRKSA